jgi:hypothetical protein
VAAVALANKNARVMWALLARGDSYEWVPLEASQIDALFTVVRRLPKRRVIVVRPDTPDSATLAAQVAKIFQEQSELLVPPYSLMSPPSNLNLGHMIATADPGIQIYAPPKSR